jgi:pyruvate dehydrogenase E2 component (dihydrolipoamide acetyltransferase)
VAFEVVMPRLGWTMEVGRVVEWLKRDGDQVQAGELLFLVETEKAVTEVESLDSGVLRIPPDAPAVGEDVEVGAMLAWLVPPGEALPFAPGDSGGAPAISGPASGRLVAEPVVVASAAELVVERNDVVAIAAAGSKRAARPAISPRARRTAEALGIDWRVIAGSGDGGRIRERDVLAAVG